MHEKQGSADAWPEGRVNNGPQIWQEALQPNGSTEWKEKEE
jgi:hypothetical protein